MILNQVIVSEVFRKLLFVCECDFDFLCVCAGSTEAWDL